MTPADQGEGPVFSAAQMREARMLLARFSAARKASRFYPPGHPAVEQGVDELMESIRSLHSEGLDIPLVFYEDELLLGEQFLPEASVHFDQLIRDMTAVGAGSITFTRGLGADELGHAVRVLSRDPVEVEEAGGLGRLLEGEDLPHVSVATVEVWKPREAADRDDREAARRTYSEGVDLLRELELAMRRAEGGFPAHTKAVVRGLVDNVLHNRGAMLELAGLRDYDEYTFYHSVNVAILSIALGAHITSERRFLTSLGTGALMHDIGKMAVGPDILNKTGPLTEREWELMRLHPVWGAETALSIPGLDRSSLVMILEHHMRYDGQGYPRYPEAGRRQHLSSRIVAVADAFDAMTSRRAYSAARLADEAMAVLVQDADSAYDPRLVRAFLRVVGVYPPRTVVRLSTGETGVVVASNEKAPTRPVVRLFADEDGELSDPVDVDLAAGEREETTITRSLDAAKLNVDPDSYM